MNYIEKKVSTSDGLRLYVRDYHPAKTLGKPVLCLSGLTRNSEDFDFIADVLHKKGHRVVTLDYRGRGKSEFDENWTNYCPATYVSDIFQITAALGLHQCIFLGTSLGGLLSMAMAVVSPGLVHSVILNDVGPDLDEGGLAKIIAYTGDSSGVADLDGAVEKLQKFYPDEHAFTQADWRNIAKKTYKYVNGCYVPNWDTKIAENLKEGGSTKEHHDLWPYFNALGDRKVLVIRGGVSSVFKKETYEKMLAKLPNIKGLELPEIGHAPTLEESDAVEEIVSFLS